MALSRSLCMKLVTKYLHGRREEPNGIQTLTTFTRHSHIFERLKSCVWGEHFQQVHNLQLWRKKAQIMWCHKSLLAHNWRSYWCEWAASRAWPPCTFSSRVRGSGKAWPIFWEPPIFQFPYPRPCCSRGRVQYIVGDQMGKHNGNARALSTSCIGRCSPYGTEPATSDGIQVLVAFRYNPRLSVQISTVETFLQRRFGRGHLCPGGCLLPVISVHVCAWVVRGWLRGEPEAAMASPDKPIREDFYRVELNKAVWEVPARYQEINAIGTGAYGTVWLVQTKEFYLYVLHVLILSQRKLHYHVTNNHCILELLKDIF